MQKLTILPEQTQDYPLTTNEAGIITFALELRVHTLRDRLTCFQNWGSEHCPTIERELQEVSALLAKVKDIGRAPLEVQ